MEQETLFTASKWQILKLLSERSLSPIELAAKSNTSVANVSQQLRLLEMAGLVTSERVSNREKGQPRILYSLAGNQSFLIATTNDFVEKKLFQLSAYNKIILRIWFHENRALHYYLEKAFWQIEQHLDKIDALALNQSVADKVALILFSRDNSLEKEAKPFSITGPDGTTREVAFTVAHPDKASAEIKSADLYALYDPGTVIPSLNEDAKKETE